MKKFLTAFLGTSLLFMGSYGFAKMSFDSEPQAETSANIVAMVAESSDFSILAEALEAADLLETLSGEGPYTVFAPTNEAFEMLPEGTMDFLLQPDNLEMLTAILTYHVVPGKITSEDFETGPVETVNGADLTIVETQEGVNVGAGEVKETDIEAANGIIHIIDTVVLPPEN